MSGPEYQRCGWCDRRLKIRRKIEVSGIALCLPDHANCPRGAVVIKWLEVGDGLAGGAR